MSLIALGINHKTASIKIRDRINFANRHVGGALAELCQQKGVSEAAILSTCNRTELYCKVNNYEQAPMIWLHDYYHIQSDQLKPFLYTHTDSSAVRHMLRVACGLDSMVLGEPQILGQLKNAYQNAYNAGSLGQQLNRLFEHSFKVAKVVRSTTTIGKHPISIGYAGVQLAQQIFGPLAKQTALLIGAGKTIELVAWHLHKSNLKQMIIANRTLQNSEAIAKRYSAYAAQLDDISKHLEMADIVISATSSQQPIINKPMLEAILQKRKHRPIFIIDLAVPRDIDHKVNELKDVYLYNIDDLQNVIDKNMIYRQEGAVQAEQIVEHQTNEFMGWLNSLNAIPTICELREKTKAIEQQAIDQGLKKLNAGVAPEIVLKETAHNITQKIIHSPSQKLRQASAEKRSDLLKAIKELFNLI